MDAALDSLPDDMDALRALAGVQHAKIAGLTAEVERLQAQAARYEHIIAQLRRLTFGKRSEQMDKDQLQLALEDLQQGAAEIEAQEEKDDPELKAHRTRQRRESRPSLPWPPAARGRGHRTEEHRLSVLRRSHACDRRGRRPSAWTWSRLSIR